DLGLSPYQTYFQDNQEIVSPASGNLILNTVDISILGRNGLDLIIGRTYDNTTAVLESLADQDLKDSKKVYHTFGTGWSLNISSIETNENGQYLYFEDGSPCKLEWEMDGNGMDGGGHGTVEYHEGHHFVGEKVQNKVKDVKFLIIKVGEEWDDAETIISRKDGKLYYFDGEGKILSIVDQTGNNKIEFFYNDKKLDKILDTIGREIDFKYNEKGKIENITSSEINYRYEYDEVEVIYGYKEIWNQQLKYRTRILDELDWTEGDYKYKEPLRYIVWVISVQ
ncbi:MAG: hypothetical protein KAX49_05165, partial [Halanaerobiales bacterium]|nr:hypothetical protein [Halanaerobiales bacterium]